MNRCIALFGQYVFVCCGTKWLQVWMQYHMHQQHKRGRQQQALTERNRWLLVRGITRWTEVTKAMVWLRCLLFVVCFGNERHSC